jgi:hypothetical protein
VSKAYTGDVRSKYGADAPIFFTALLAGKIEQLQIDLGMLPGKFYRTGADYAQNVMEICKRAKGRVNFLERLP